MAGTVNTHRTLLGQMVTKPLLFVINFSILSPRYFKAEEKTSMAGSFSPLIAAISWLSLNDCMRQEIKHASALGGNVRVIYRTLQTQVCVYLIAVRALTCTAALQRLACTIR